MERHEGKIFPLPSAETLRYWEGCGRGELLLQRCKACKHMQFYPRTLCAACMSSELEWARASGRGTLLSYTVVHKAVSAAYKDEVPYIVALITLDEGPVLMSNLVDYANADVAIGLPVQVVFEKWSEDITVPKFKPMKRG